MWARGGILCDLHLADHPRQPRETCARDRTGDGHAGERKGRIESWRSGAAHDVGAHPQPVRLQSFIAYPGLKISGRRKKIALA